MSSPGRRRNGWLILLGALCAVGPLSIDMYLPAMPAIAHSFGASEGTAGLSIASYLVGLLYGQVVFGALSDQIGRKRPLYFGLLLYVAASLLCATCESPSVFIASRLVQGFGGCSGMVVARAVIRDRTVGTESARAFSMLMLVVSAVPLLSPPLGALLLCWYEWRLLFAVMASFGGICLAAVHYTMRESYVQRKGLPASWLVASSGFLTLLSCRTFMTYTLCNALAQGVMYAYITGSPFFLIELYQLSPNAYSGILAFGSLGLIAASQINTRLVGRFSLDRIIRWSSLALAMLGLCGIFEFFFKLDPLFFTAKMFLCLTCLGFIAPNCAALALEKHGTRAGIASAFMGTILFAVGAICAGTIAIFQDTSSSALVWVVALCGMSAFYAYWQATRAEQK